ncbi:low choriolytic enzyme-like isoform X1 [Hippocampus zosterae]|uniref:low choriolytic enzyme-like isoform X1 n=2 Tax=Hippocampus zosterae TaxID=109293 RepID=UPI00223CE7E0|nr:low choriolytic enzyme-like isoform X1 [Hippocampus zosterae]
MTPVVIIVLLLSVTAVSPVPISESNRQKREVTSTFAKIVKANENVSPSRLRHGDILVHTSVEDGIARNAVPCTSAGCKWPKIGNTVTVPYEISKAFTKSQRRTIIEALTEFERGNHMTCIRFVKKTKEDVNYISFISGTGCWSYLGRQGNAQPISLQKNGCVSKDIVQHEALHALGFHHEHVRSDRDEHVIINFENIISGFESNFEIVQTNNLGTTYDFLSVMHYGEFDFSRNGRPTIVARDSAVTTFGTATEMSANDYERVNRLYDCCE